MAAFSTKYNARIMTYNKVGNIYNGRDQIETL